MKKKIIVNQHEKRFLEAMLCKEIKNGNLGEIESILVRLNRGLSDSEKKLIIRLSKNAIIYKQIEAFRLTGLTEDLTQKHLLDYVKLGHYPVSDITDLKPDPKWVEAIIRYFVEKGNPRRAIEYANALNRKLTRNEINKCFSAIVKNMYWFNEKQLQKEAELLGMKKIPYRYKKQLREQTRKRALLNRNYSVFKAMGGTKEEFGKERFKKLVDQMIRNESVQSVLELVNNEKLFYLDIIPKLLEKVVSKSHVGNKTLLRESKRFIKHVPKKLLHHYVRLMVQRKAFTVLPDLGIPINDFIIKEFIGLVKKDLQRKELLMHFDMDNVINKFPRKPKKQEVVILLEHTAHKQNYETVFDTAKRYSYPITLKLIRVMEKVNR